MVLRNPRGISSKSRVDSLTKDGEFSQMVGVEGSIDHAFSRSQYLEYRGCSLRVGKSTGRKRGEKEGGVDEGARESYACGGARS